MEVIVVRRFHRAVQYFASFMLVMLAFCQPTAHAQGNISVEELARQLNETQRRLQQTELELRSLRDRARVADKAGLQRRVAAFNRVRLQRSYENPIAPQEQTAVNRVNVDLFH